MNIFLKGFVCMLHKIAILFVCTIFVGFVGNQYVLHAQENTEVSAPAEDRVEVDAPLSSLTVETETNILPDESADVVPVSTVRDDSGASTSTLSSAGAETSVFSCACNTY